MKKASSLKNKFKTKLSSLNLHNRTGSVNANCQLSSVNSCCSSSAAQTSSSQSTVGPHSSESNDLNCNQELVRKAHYFKEGHRTYSCIHCRAQLASHDELVSKLFQGNQGRAYLFNKVVNVNCRQAVRRQLLTGPHEVADIYCANCETTLGWKYEQAFVASQKYKEGKYIIELIHMYKGNEWDITSYNSQSIIREVNESCGRKFGVDDFTIGKNYFGSLDLLEQHLNRSDENKLNVNLAKKTIQERDTVESIDPTGTNDKIQSNESKIDNSNNYNIETTNTTSSSTSATERHSVLGSIQASTYNNNNLHQMQPNSENNNFKIDIHNTDSNNNNNRNNNNINTGHSNSINQVRCQEVLNSEQIYINLDIKSIREESTNEGNGRETHHEHHTRAPLLNLNDKQPDGSKEIDKIIINVRS